MSRKNKSVKKNSSTPFKVPAVIEDKGKNVEKIGQIGVTPPIQSIQSIQPQPAPKPEPRKNFIPISEGMRFTPAAWQKILFFTYRGDTEVGGFCITHKDDPSLIIDYQIVKQECTSVTFDFDPQGLADFTDEMLDKGYQPSQFFRYYYHNHPGTSATPSSVDWENFNTLMSSYPFFGMLIMSKSGEKYGYLKLTQGPGAEVEIDFDVDWNIPCEPVDFAELEQHYQEKVTKKTFAHSGQTGKQALPPIPSKFQENYQAIDWGTRSSNHNLKSSWERHASHYKSIWEAEYDEDEDEDEKAISYNEYLMEKSVSSMTQQEFEDYQKLLDEITEVESEEFLD